MRTIGIGLAGCGQVGSALVSMLTESGADIGERTGLQIELRALADRSFRNPRRLGIPQEIWVDHPLQLVGRRDLDCVVELIGGTDAAADLVLAALRAGTSVVSANKALIAERGPELIRAAAEGGGRLLFEAAVTAGVPVIRAISDGLAGNRVTAVSGIVNGTCNQILTQMARDGLDFATALSRAQQEGLAEADPSLDITGLDSAHKLSILAMLAMGIHVSPQDIRRIGIADVNLEDIGFAAGLGLKLKLIAEARHLPEGPSLRVEPRFLPEHHPLAWVEGPFNAVSVSAEFAGHTLYYGRGAGPRPTASAVLSDIVAFASGTAGRAALGPELAMGGVQQGVGLAAASAERARFYLRADMTDAPGSLASLTGVLGRRGISIDSMVQRHRASSPGVPVPVVSTTHHAARDAMDAALTDIAGLGCVHGSPVCIPLMDEQEDPAGLSESQ